MDGRCVAYVGAVAAALGHALGPSLVGVYLHGSAVLGGFDPHRSDLDILAVCTRPMTPAAKHAVAGGLTEPALPCPAVGLELSVITRTTARTSTPQPPFELHPTTAMTSVTSVSRSSERWSLAVTMPLWATTPQLSGRG